MSVLCLFAGYSKNSVSLRTYTYWPPARKTTGRTAKLRKIKDLMNNMSYLTGICDLVAHIASMRDSCGTCVHLAT